MIEAFNLNTIENLKEIRTSMQLSKYIIICKFKILNNEYNYILVDSCENYNDALNKLTYQYALHSNRTLYELYSLNLINKIGVLNNVIYINDILSKESFKLKNKYEFYIVKCECNDKLDDMNINNIIKKDDVLKYFDKNLFFTLNDLIELNLNSIKFDLLDFENIDGNNIFIVEDKNKLSLLKHNDILLKFGIKFKTLNIGDKINIKNLFKTGFYFENHEIENYFKSLLITSYY